MFQCFRAAKIPVHSTSPDQPPSPWRLFARKFERIMVAPGDEDEIAKIRAKIERDGAAKIRAMQLLASIQKEAAASSGGRGDREQSVGAASRTSSSAAGKRPAPDTFEDRQAKKAALAEAASKSEAAENLAAIEREAALFAAEQRGEGDCKLRPEWHIQVKVLKPEIEASVIATHACVREFCELVRTLFICNNVSPDFLPPGKFANLALLTNPEDSPAPADLLLRERLSAVIAVVRRLQPLAVRAGAQARRLADMYRLMHQTLGADAWTCRQLQGREVSDEQRLPLDIHYPVLRTWEEKVKSALIHADQRGAFLPGATTLRGPVDPLVAAHLSSLRRAGNHGRPAFGDSNRGGRGGSGGGHQRRPGRL